MKAWIKLKSAIKAHANIRSESERLIDLHGNILLNAISNKKKQQLEESYANEKTLEGKIDALAKQIIDIDLQLSWVSLKLIRAQQKRNAWKTTFVLLLWATFFPLYIATGDKVWLILIICIFAFYFLYTLLEMWKSKKIADTCNEILIKKLVSSKQN